MGIANLEEMHAKGDISDEEFRTIQSRNHQLAAETSSNGPDCPTGESLNHQVPSVCPSTARNPFPMHHRYDLSQPHEAVTDYVPSCLADACKGDSFSNRNVRRTTPPPVGPPNSMLGLRIRKQ